MNSVASGVSIPGRLLAACGVYLLLLSAVAHASNVSLSEADVRAMNFRTPLLDYAPGPVKAVVKPGLCLDCGDYWRPYGTEAALYLKIFQADFRTQLKTVIQGSGLLKGTGPRMVLQATLEDFKGSSSVDASTESRNPLSSAAVLTITTVVRYEMLEGERVLASWIVESRGSSGSMQKWEEACGRSLARNIRKFMAGLKQDLVQDLTPEERAFIAQVDQERDSKRSLIGNIMVGVAKTTKVAGEVGGVTMRALAAEGTVIMNGRSFDEFQRDSRADLAATHDQLVRNVTAQSAERQRLQDEHEARLRDVDRQRAERLAEDRALAAQQRPAAEATPKVVIPEYRPAVVTLPSWPKECPPGSSPWRGSDGSTAAAPGAVCIRDDDARRRTASSSGATAETGAAANGQKAGATPGDKAGDEKAAGHKKVEWGEVLLEAVAVCRQSTKSGKWVCNGSLDNQIIVDEPTLESALERQRCTEGVETIGGPVLEGVQWQAYACGRGLEAGGFDIVKRYGLITPQRSYRCKRSHSGMCAELYEGGE